MTVIVGQATAAFAAMDLSSADSRALMLGSKCQQRRCESECVCSTFVAFALNSFKVSICYQLCARSMHVSRARIATKKEFKSLS